MTLGNKQGCRENGSPSTFWREGCFVTEGMVITVGIIICLQSGLWLTEQGNRLWRLISELGVASYPPTA